MATQQAPRIPNPDVPIGLLGAVRQWVYPAKVTGRFQRVHRILGYLQLVLFFALPWVKVHGHPAFLLDIDSRRLYLFGSMFTATDTVLVVLSLLFGAFSLFFFTALFGRLWCGYACPQTVFLEELIRPIESLIEGDRGARMMRDVRGRWTPDWVWRKVAKWAAFVVVAVGTAGSFVSYFVPALELWTGAASTAAYGSMSFFSAIMLADFGWFREQFCNYLCPYARFQGALTDDQTLVIAYDVQRGEPRGTSRRKGEQPTGACIDCKKCTNVCPAGIDIRNGFQLECVNCARCVDACEGVMGKIGQPSLVSYTTIAESEGRKVKWIRPRTVVYAAILCAVLAGFGVALSSHHLIYANVNRAPGSLFTVDNDGWIRNTYMVRVTNNHVDSTGAEKFRIEVEGLPEGADVRSIEVEIAPEQTVTVPLIVRLPPDSKVPRTLPIEVKVIGANDEVELDTTFKSEQAL